MTMDEKKQTRFCLEDVVKFVTDIDNNLSALPLPSMVAMDRELWYRLFEYVKLAEAHERQ